MDSKYSKNNLVWLDLEMTGLDPYIDTILEVAVIISDPDLVPIEKGFNMIVNHPENILKTMDEWNTTTHIDTGLYEKVLKSPYSLAEVESSLLEYVKRYIPEKTSPLCGNTIWQDRMFLINYMPKFNGYMHYRNIDVSTIKELSYKWYPDINRFIKKEKHSALQDIIESIEEMKFYRQKIFK